MTFGGSALAAALTAQTCPSLENILGRAYQMGITQDGQPVTGLNMQHSRVTAAEPELLPAKVALSGPANVAALNGAVPDSDAASSGRKLTGAIAPAGPPAAAAAAPTPAADPASTQPSAAYRTATSTTASLSHPAAVEPPLATLVAPATTPATAAAVVLPTTSGPVFEEAVGQPYLKLTFMFGFTSNRTFPYGKGNTLTAPAGSIKWTLEADNW